MDVFHYFSKRFIWEQRFALTADGLTYLSAVLLLILTVQALIPSRFALSGPVTLLTTLIALWSFHAHVWRHRYKKRLPLFWQLKSENRPVSFIRLGKMKKLALKKGYDAKEVNAFLAFVVKHDLLEKELNYFLYKLRKE